MKAYKEIIVISNFLALVVKMDKTKFNSKTVYAVEKLRLI